jgi:hypothetical protein
MINTRASLQQITHRGMLLYHRKRWLIVVDAQLLKCVVEVDFAARHGNPDERIQQALAAGVQIRAACNISPGGYHYSMLHNHCRARSDLLDIFVYFRQVLRRPARLFRRRKLLPCHPRHNIRFGGRLNRRPNEQ